MYKHTKRKDDVKTHRKKTAIYKPRREIWNQSFSQNSQKEPTLPHFDIGPPAYRTVTAVSLLSLWCFCYSSPSRLTHRGQWYPIFPTKEKRCGSRGSLPKNCQFQRQLSFFSVSLIIQ